MIDYVILVGFFIVALLIGGALGLRAGLNQRPKPVEDPKPICGCSHHASFHDDDGCHYLHMDDYGREEHRCGCVRYIGPVAYDALP